MEANLVITETHNGLKRVTHMFSQGLNLKREEKITDLSNVVKDVT